MKIMRVKFSPKGCFFYPCRYNIPELAKTHTVYAVDLLGFGLSEKALIEYDADVWRDQVADFVREVVGKPAVLAGNRCKTELLC